MASPRGVVISENERPRWAIITPNLERGPFAKRTKTLGKAFLARGLAVDALYLEHHGASVGLAKGVRSLPLHGRARWSFLQIAKYLREEGPDVVLSLGYMMNVPSLIAARFARFRGVLLVNEGTLPTTGLADYPRPFSKPTIRLGYGVFYRRSDAIVCNSDAVCAALKTFLPSSSLRQRLTVITNPVELEESGQSAEMELPDTGMEPVFLCLGRLIPLKRVDAAIEAFSLFAAENGVGHLVIGGEGPEAPRLRELASELRLDDRVHFLGHVNGVEPILKRTTVLIHLAESEGFGNVVAEALASGTPAIVAKGSGGPEGLIRDGGFVVDRDPKSVFRAMNDLWINEETLADKQSGALNDSRSLSPESVADTWMALVKSIDRNRAKSARYPGL